MTNTSPNSAIELYIEGVTTGNSESLNAAFHPDARVFGALGDQRVDVPIQDMIGMISAQPADVDGQFSASIRKIDEFGDIGHLGELGAFSLRLRQLAPRMFEITQLLLQLISLRLQATPCMLEVPQPLLEVRDLLLVGGGRGGCDGRGGSGGRVRSTLRSSALIE